MIASIRVVAIFASFTLFPSLVVADPLCWLRTQSPLDAVMVKQPLLIKNDWTVIPLPKPLKVSPHVQEITLYLKRGEFQMIDLGNVDKHPESWRRRVPRSKQTQQVHLFDVQIRNTKLGYVDLVYASNAYPPDQDNSYLSLGFSNHPEKNQFFYPEGSQIDEIRVRANQPVVVEKIRWEAYGYWKWPCRKWSEVPASEIMTPQQ